MRRPGRRGKAGLRLAIIFPGANTVQSEACFLLPAAEPWSQPAPRQQQLSDFLFSLLFHVTQHGHPSSDSTGPFCSNTTTLCWLFSLSAFKPPCPNSKQPSSCKEVAGEEALSGHRREAPLKRWCGQGCTPMPATRTYLSAGILTSTSNYESENLTSATLP